MVVVVYQCGFIKIDPLHNYILVLVGSGAVCFSLGGRLARLIPIQTKTVRFNALESTQPPPLNRLYFWKFLMLMLSLFLMLQIAYSTISTGLSGGPGSILLNAREAGLSNASENGGISGVLSAYVSLWVNCTALMFFLERRDRWFWVMALVALITAISTTGRGPVLQIFIMLVTAYLIKTHQLGFRAATRFARVPILMFLFFYIGLTFTNKNTSVIEGGILGIAIYFVVSYMIGPVVAMDYVLEHTEQYAGNPNHTFKLFAKLGDFFHLWSYSPPPLLDKFIEVPFPTNVYTGYKFYFTDFGFVGCLIVVGIIGFIHSFLYRKALMESQLALYAFCFFNFCLVMFIFDDLYSAVGQIICVCIFGILYQSLRRLRLLPRNISEKVRFSVFPKKHDLAT